jgi:chromosome partitioning protein
MDPCTAALYVPREDRELVTNAQCIATSASAVARNRVNRRGKLTEDIAADLASAGTPVAATRIGNRVALAQAMALGFGVIENARTTPAAAEISALAEEIRGAISG